MFTFKVFVHWARVLSAPESSYEHARFTRISTRPQEEITDSTNFEIEESSVTSP